MTLIGLVTTFQLFIAGERRALSGRQQLILCLAPTAEGSNKITSGYFFFSFRLKLIPRRREVSHSDPLLPHVSSPGVIWFQVEKFQVLLNHVHPSLLLPSSAAKSPYF